MNESAAYLANECFNLFACAKLKKRRNATLKTIQFIISLRNAVYT